ncbi:unnamed protein product [Schistosoma curassoni]|uniref:Ovule protein n=1 Tax=Schistosoma curassoni TaxID=6186 RepID=A0A183JL79_9TREM|nr:unnamed protein product [Schistosoma curassoni]
MDQKNKDSIPTVEEYMGLKTTVCQSTSNSESSIRTLKQPFLLYGTETCRTTTTLIKKGTSIYIQLSTQNIQYPLIGYNLSQPTMEQNKPASS